MPTAVVADDDADTGDNDKPMGAEDQASSHAGDEAHARQTKDDVYYTLQEHDDVVLDDVVDSRRQQQQYVVDAKEEVELNATIFSTSTLNSTSSAAAIAAARSQHKSRLVQLLRVAAQQAIHEQDPWKRLQMHNIPAERVKRWFYDRDHNQWHSDETIVKMEAQPFTKGAMRSCYRLKKRAVLPQSATNTRFHKCSWSTSALNYVAKAYLCPVTQQIDASSTAKEQVKNDIVLQHEAQHWAHQYNDRDPPTRILFLRSYAIEFVDRPHQPWLALERYITGQDAYGATFVKHNTNSGYVDLELRRVTPQVFSAFTFYASHGTRLVADIQGVGDLYTDPQVLSDDYRFGDGDLGPRGMALFFRTYRNCGTSDGLGIPIFPLSKNELKVQSKYEDDEVTLSDEEDESSYDDKDDDEVSGARDMSVDRASMDDDGSTHRSLRSRDKLDRFQRLDLNRLRRSRLLHADHPPRHVVTANATTNGDSSDLATQVRSNLSSLVLSQRSIKMPGVLSSSVLHKSTTASPPTKSQLPSPHKFYHRTKSDVDEVSMCLQRAATHRQYSMSDFHRAPSGDLEPRRFKKPNGNGIGSGGNGPQSGTTSTSTPFHKSALVRKLSSPMIPNEQCRCNLGKVHYQLAVLHGLNRFPDVAEVAAHGTATVSDNNSADCPDRNPIPDHDVLSVLFHLSHASSLMNPPACLALARVLSGRPSSVSHLLPTIVPVDFELSKELLQRAMMTSTLLSQSAARQSVAPKLSAGCLLLTLLLEEQRRPKDCLQDDEDESEVNVAAAPADVAEEDPPMDGFTRRVLEDTIELFHQYHDEKRQAEVHRHVTCNSQESSSAGTNAGHVLASVLRVGDKVEANYALEGTYYSAVVTTLTHPSTAIEASVPVVVTVKYDDDGSSEDLPIDQVRIVIPPTATQTRLGGPRTATTTGGCDTEDDDFGDEDIDCEILLPLYELQALLAKALEQEGGGSAAAAATAAAELYEQAAAGAAEDGKMQKATAWSLKASELLLQVQQQLGGVPP